MQRIDLIDDVWRKIFCLLTTTKRAPLAQVCKHWKYIIFNQNTWKSFEFVRDSESNSESIINASLLKFVTSYCTAAEDVVLNGYLADSPEEFLDQIFQIRSLRRLALSLGAWPGNFRTRAEIKRAILCKDLQVLNIQAKAVTIINFDQLLSGLPNLKELYIDFKNTTALTECKKLERFSISFQTKTAAERFQVEQMIQNCALQYLKLFIARDQNKDLATRNLPMPAKINNTLVVYPSAFGDRELKSYVREIAPYLDIVEDASVISALAGSTATEELVHLVTTYGFSVNSVGNMTPSYYRPNFFFRAARVQAYPLKSAVVAGLLENITALKSLGANPNSLLHNDSPLLHARSPSIYKTLITDVGCDPNKLINGIPVFMYLLMQPEKIGLLSSTKPEIHAADVIAVLAGRCDLNKKFRGQSFADLAFRVKLPNSSDLDLIAHLVKENLVQWTPHLLERLFFLDYDLFFEVIFKPDFDWSLIKVASLVHAYSKRPSETRLRDAILQKRDHTGHDEHGLTLTHYVALCRTVQEMSPYTGNDSFIHVSNREERWVGGNTLAPQFGNPFLIVSEAVDLSLQRFLAWSNQEQTTVGTSETTTVAFKMPANTVTTQFGSTTTTNLFGQPAQTSTFGQPATSGFAQLATSSLGQPTQTSTFGQPAASGFSPFGSSLGISSFTTTGSFVQPNTSTKTSAFPVSNKITTVFGFGQQPSTSEFSNMPSNTTDISGFSSTPPKKATVFGFGQQPSTSTSTSGSSMDTSTNIPVFSNMPSNTTTNSTNPSGFSGFAKMPSTVSFEQTIPTASLGLFGSPAPAPSNSNSASPPYFLASVTTLSAAAVEELIASQRESINIRSLVGESPLLLLCKSSWGEGNKELNAKLLLQYGADVNLADNHGWTPLHAAMMLGQYRLAEFLLENGANINAQDNLGITPLMAWFYGLNFHNTPKHVSTKFAQQSKPLVQRQGIDFTLADKNFNRSVIHLMACVAAPSCLDLVLKGSAPHVVLEARDVDGLTPLHHAVMYCNYDMIAYLIQHGANVNAQSYALKLTPLMMYMAIHKQDHSYRSKHHNFCLYLNTMMLGRYRAINVPNASNQRYFSLSEPFWIGSGTQSEAFSPRVNVMHDPKSFVWKKYLTPDTDVTLADRHGDTLLHMIVTEQGGPTIYDDPAQWQELSGLWNSRNAKGNTPLHLLIQSCSPTSAAILKEGLLEFITKIDPFVDLHVVNNKGVSALEMLLMMKGMTIPLKLQVLELAKKGSKPDSPPVSHTIQPTQRSVLHALLQSPEAVLTVGLVTTTLTQFSHEINAQDEDGNTALMVLLQRLFEGESVAQDSGNAFGRKGAEEKKEDEPVCVSEPFAPYLEVAPIIEYLMTYPGADFNLQNHVGDTVLHIVCRFFHVGALEAMLCNFNSFNHAAKYCLIAFKLLDAGAQVTIKNKCGETVLDYAPLLMYHYQHVYPRIRHYKPRPFTLGVSRTEIEGTKHYNFEGFDKQ